MCNNCNQPEWFCSHNRGTGKFEPLKQITNIQISDYQKLLDKLMKKNMTKSEKGKYIEKRLAQAWKAYEYWQNISRKFVNDEPVDIIVDDRPDEHNLKS